MVCGGTARRGQGRSSPPRALKPGGPRLRRKPAWRPGSPAPVPAVQRLREEEGLRCRMLGRCEGPIGSQTAKRHQPSPTQMQMRARQGAACPRAPMSSASRAAEAALEMPSWKCRSGSATRLGSCQAALQASQGFGGLRACKACWPNSRHKASLRRRGVPARRKAGIPAAPPSAPERRSGIGRYLPDASIPAAPSTVPMYMARVSSLKSVRT